ncbi:MAG: hypothetical protein COW01_06140 [Bdellovibrionales bacterium CG12_big_fil_rev_8_21_14_0_65_38_15]|nr:MAG: hypothetical protein COW79_04035 [Bdellovibrionales bacterium CG22_combo_CG10-13_8_21_14_all_38_13]PIQ56008.1 MAG: hypothetical protein COW01_06140 [Bdellovibrionales bacterium CG12_big_fil_rev_8_21_14_0_65_38_15]PIR30613.1 MAG: hypothetical protein COV38_04680 [Bdellovibrionales bacterium CG11_big_fil_rev_8_21_14_0_20_38_13]
MYKKKNPKKPSDYKTLRIRVPPEVEMQDILKKVEKIRARLNKKKDPNRKVWMGNHVLLEAIEIGLENLGKHQK